MFVNSVKIQTGIEEENELRQIAIKQTGRQFLFFVHVNGGRHWTI